MLDRYIELYYEDAVDVYWGDGIDELIDEVVDETGARERKVAECVAKLLLSFLRKIPEVIIDERDDDVIRAYCKKQDLPKVRRRLKEMLIEYCSGVRVGESRVRRFKFFRKRG